MSLTSFAGERQSCTQCLTFARLKHGALLKHFSPILIIHRILDFSVATRVFKRSVSSVEQYIERIIAPDHWQRFGPKLVGDETGRIGAS
jgi:hypothetical protein